MHGTFAVVTQDDNLIDGPEFVVLTGSLIGRAHLSPAIINEVPLGRISGTWTTRGRGAVPDQSGTFTGTFRMPFDAGGTASYMLTPTQIVPVLDNERAIGQPTVRLELAIN